MFGERRGVPDVLQASVCTGHVGRAGVRVATRKRVVVHTVQVLVLVMC
jgi:hypothetical protein